MTMQNEFWKAQAKEPVTVDLISDLRRFFAECVKPRAVHPQVLGPIPYSVWKDHVQRCTLTDCPGHRAVAAP